MRGICRKECVELNTLLVLQPRPPALTPQEVQSPGGSRRLPTPQQAGSAAGGRHQGDTDTGFFPQAIRTVNPDLTRAAAITLLTYCILDHTFNTFKTQQNIPWVHWHFSKPILMLNANCGFPNPSPPPPVCDQDGWTTLVCPSTKPSLTRVGSTAACCTT